MKAEYRKTLVERDELSQPMVELLGGLAPLEQESELEETMARMHQELAESSKVEFRVIVEGTPVRLRPVAEREVRLVCREALKNAYRHSHANTIEAEVSYRAKELRVVVRDNGVGMGSEVLKGLDGNRGLARMKWQTESLGGKLRVLSQAGAGTEIEMSLAGLVAFAAEPKKWTAVWLDMFYTERAERTARISA